MRLTPSEVGLLIFSSLLPVTRILLNFPCPYRSYPLNRSPFPLPFYRGKICRPSHILGAGCEYISQSNNTCFTYKFLQAIAGHCGLNLRDGTAGPGFHARGRRKQRLDNREFLLLTSYMCCMRSFQPVLEH
jgi:hypothetical protein